MRLRVERTIVRDGRPGGEESLPAAGVSPMPIPKQRKPPENPYVHPAEVRTCRHEGTMMEGECDCFIHDE